MDQRSLGLQYSFSFYVIFLVEATGAHKNAILLLDEPGLHVHGTAQRKIVTFLEKLAEQNQTLYTTHSPFMIDGDHLERIRVVYEAADGSTKVTEDIWPKDKDALFPLQAALGYSIIQSLFYSKRQVIVEGITDYWIFKSINEVLFENHMDNLRNDIVLVPVGGVNNLLPLASMLLGHEIELAVILDGDEPGRRKGRELQERLLSGMNGKCVFIGDFTDIPEAELEDLFPENFYIDAVKESYNIELQFTKEEQAIKNITKKISAAFIRLNKGKFEKWRPAKLILDWIGKDKEILTDDLLSKFSSIFREINSHFK